MTDTKLFGRSELTDIIGWSLSGWIRKNLEPGEELVIRGSGMVSVRKADGALANYLDLRTLINLRTVDPDSAD